MTSTPQPPLGSYPPPTAKRDLTLAWLAHLLMLFTGFIGPLVVWLVKKDDDKVAAYHGKQAFFFALSIAALIICFWIFAGLIGIVLHPFFFMGFCMTWATSIAAGIYIIFATIQTAHGKPFKYIVVADMFCKKEFAEAYPGLAAAAAAPIPPAPPAAP
jgi:uncharacterized protein